MRHLVLLAVLFLLCVAPAVQADITLLSKAQARKQKEWARLGPLPPEPVPAKITARRGEKVEILLQVFGVPNEPFTYEVRSGPTEGKLSAPRMVGRGIGAVIYEPPENGADHDSFWFVTRSARGVSAANQVSITITNDPPVLYVTGDLDFGRVTSGSTLVREVNFENRGGGFLKGTLTVAEPWKIEGVANYNLRAGEHHSVYLRFSPRDERRYAGELHFSSHPNQPAPLRGEAEASIGIAPARLELRAAQEAARTGTLKLTNRTAEEQPVRLQIGSHLTGPVSVTVPAHGQFAVELATLPGAVEAVEEAVEIRAPGFAARVAVHAAAAGPIIRVLPTVLSFGQIKAGVTASVPLQVMNAGGSRALVKLATSLPLAVAPADGEFSLDPGQMREIKITAEEPPDGPLSGALRIKVSGQETSVPIEAQVTGGQPNPEPIPTPPPEPARELRIPATDEPPAAEPLPVAPWWKEARFLKLLGLVLGLCVLIAVWRRRGGSVDPIEQKPVDIPPAQPYYKPPPSATAPPGLPANPLTARRLATANAGVKAAPMMREIEPGKWALVGGE